MKSYKGSITIDLGYVVQNAILNIALECFNLAQLNTQIQQSIGITVEKTSDITNAEKLAIATYAEQHGIASTLLNTPTGWAILAGSVVLVVLIVFLFWPESTQEIAKGEAEAMQTLAYGQTGQPRPMEPQQQMWQPQQMWQQPQMGPQQMGPQQMGQQPQMGQPQQMWQPQQQMGPPKMRPQLLYPDIGQQIEPLTQYPEIGGYDTTSVSDINLK